MQKVVAHMYFIQNVVRLLKWKHLCSSSFLPPAVKSCPSHSTDCPPLTFHPFAVTLPLSLNSVRKKYSITPPPVLTSGSEPVYLSNPPPTSHPSLSSSHHRLLAWRLKALQEAVREGGGVVACDREEQKLWASWGRMNDPQPPQSLRDCWLTDGSVHDVQTQMLHKFVWRRHGLQDGPWQTPERERGNVEAITVCTAKNASDLTFLQDIFTQRTILHGQIVF